MKQLGNQDVGFIYSDSPTTPMHIAGLGIYDQSTAPGGRLGHKDIIKYVQDRIHFAPIFRQKLVQVPFGIDRPYWIEDPDFDIEFHIRHIALPHPGDWRQLCILVSRLNSRPLDFSRPLWEAYIIEGLDNIEGLPKGSFAIMVKVHHSAVDGASGQGVFGALHDLSRDGVAIGPDKPLTVERLPTTLELMARAVSNNVKRPVAQGKSFFQKAPNMLRSAIKLYRGELESGCKLRVPKTRFNTAVSPHRVFEGTDFALDDIKFIKDTVGQGTTINDVMLTIVGGAMTRYLTHHQEKPTDSLCAMLPQDIRSAAERTEFGNRVGGLFADLHTDIADPLKRLVQIHDSTVAAKHLAVTMDTASVVQNYMGGFLNPYLGRGLNKLLQRSRLLERMGPFVVNTLVTNVPGPNFPLYHAGAQMVKYWGIPPVMDALGLGHAVFSYCGRISLSATACRQMMPDPSFYMECVQAAFAEIFQAAKALKEGKPLAPADTAPAARRRSAASSKPSLESSSATTAKPEVAKASVNKSSGAKGTSTAGKETTPKKPAKTEAAVNAPDPAKPRRRSASGKSDAAPAASSTSSAVGSVVSQPDLEKITADKAVVELNAEVVELSAGKAAHAANG